MPYLPSPPFNPPISSVPILDSSSGDPRATKDPKSVASIGKNIQAMQDQAAADRMYDAPLKEGFNVKPNSQPMLKNTAKAEHHHHHDHNVHAKAPKKQVKFPTNRIQPKVYKPQNAPIPQPAPAAKPINMSVKMEGFSNLGLGNPENYFETSDFRYPDGFNRLPSPQIVNSQACKRIQGFSNMNANLSPLIAVTVALGAVLVLTSFL
jgi:hypothetical protein